MQPKATNLFVTLNSEHCEKHLAAAAYPPVIHQGEQSGFRKADKCHRKRYHVYELPDTTSNDGDDNYSNNDQLVMCFQALG